MNKSVLIPYLAILSLLPLSACVSTPNIGELNRVAKTVAYVENGTQPLRFSTGVIDVSSFWSAYGGGVSDRLGGSLLVDDVTKSSGEKVLSALAKNQMLVQSLYGESAFAKEIHSELLPKLAQAFNRKMTHEQVYRIDDPRKLKRENGHILNMDVDADLILMSEMHSLNLTERFSMGGALLSGVTMGTNTKNLTFETPIALYVLTKTDVKGAYKVDWRGVCGATYVTMKTAFTMEALLEHPENAQALLSEAKLQTIEGCGKLIDQLAGNA